MARKKIAVLFKADLNNRKGMTNAILSRIKYLIKAAPQDWEIQPICISDYNGFFARILRGKIKVKKVGNINIDGLNVKLEWEKFSIPNYIATVRLKKSPVLINGFKKLIQYLKDYDLVTAHSFDAGLIALDVKKQFGIPYCITWHGSDIHSAPFSSRYFHTKTIELIDNAEANFFVSKDLYTKAKKLCCLCNGEILYNGASADFKCLNVYDRLDLRRSLNLKSDDTVVGFVGNLIPVKNASLLPAIFKEIKDAVNQPVKFLIIGDGDLRKSMEDYVLKFGIEDITYFMGNQPYERMPQLMNCIDLLVLPSKNEGLPLVTVEAALCGAKVIGADAGGIAESIGHDNVVSHGNDFVQRFAQRCVDAINGDYKAQINPMLDWDKTTEKEVEIYNCLI